MMDAAEEMRVQVEEMGARPSFVVDLARQVGRVAGKRVGRTGGSREEDLGALHSLMEEFFNDQVRDTHAHEAKARAGHELIQSYGEEDAPEEQVAYEARLASELSMASTRMIAATRLFARARNAQQDAIQNLPGTNPQSVSTGAAALEEGGEAGEEEAASGGVQLDVGSLVVSLQQQVSRAGLFLAGRL